MLLKTQKGVFESDESGSSSLRHGRVMTEPCRAEDRNHHHPTNLPFTLSIVKSSPPTMSPQPPQTPQDRGKGQRGFVVETVISLVLGISAFLAFCVCPPGPSRDPAD